MMFTLTGSDNRLSGDLGLCVHTCFKTAKLIFYSIKSPTLLHMWLYIKFKVFAENVFTYDFYPQYPHGPRIHGHNSFKY
jgi:hypothetical protein